MWVYSAWTCLIHDANLLIGRTRMRTTKTVLLDHHLTWPSALDLKQRTKSASSSKSRKGDMLIFRWSIGHDCFSITISYCLSKEIQICAAQMSTQRRWANHDLPFIRWLSLFFLFILVLLPPLFTNKTCNLNQSQSGNLCASHSHRSYKWGVSPRDSAERLGEIEVDINHHTTPDSLHKTDSLTSLAPALPFELRAEVQQIDACCVVGECSVFQHPILDRKLMENTSSDECIQLLRSRSTSH